jgi:hypothetical protein
MAIKLFNKGERTITHGDFHFKPQTAGSFTPEVAAKLKRLYGDELISLEDEVSRFDAAEVVCADAKIKSDVDETADEEDSAKSKRAYSKKAK